MESFLRGLDGPACLFLSGQDSGHTRALVTLLHGNEPSGAMALHRWLQSGQHPAVNVVCIVASVAAALAAPLFSHRMLPRARDLNRCFRPPFDDAQGALAEEILEILPASNPRRWWICTTPPVPVRHSGVCTIWTGSTTPWCPCLPGG